MLKSSHNPTSSGVGNSARNYPRPLHSYHWQYLRAFKKPKPQMKLWDFLSHWEVSHAELATICQCSVSTVNLWFLSPNSPNRKEPLPKHKELLAEAHQIFLKAARAA